MFERKLGKLEKYLPYFFFDWIITYMYLNGFSSARGCQALELLILVYLISVPIDFRPTDGEGRISTNFQTLGFDLSFLRYTLTLQQYFMLGIPSTSLSPCCLEVMQKPLRSAVNQGSE